MPSSVRIGLIASFLLLLTVNVVMLDLAVFVGRSSVTKQSEIAATTVRVVTTPVPAGECALSCQAKIDELGRRIDASSATQTERSSSSPHASSGVKEYYISLGSGSTKNNVWQDIAGAEAVIDTTNYPSIKSVIFEVFLNIPTANGSVSAKLYNVTDKHDVWFSTVRSEGPTMTKKEATITLEPGAKIYRVMGLSTLKYDANIENARLRIVTY